MICPNCKNKISWYKAWSLTNFTKITCPSCQTKLSGDKETLSRVGGLGTVFSLIVWYILSEFIDKYLAAVLVVVLIFIFATYYTAQKVTLIKRS
jgi:CXXC-20-CXXC protein